MLDFFFFFDEANNYPCLSLLQICLYAALGLFWMSACRP